jgi:catechol 2,3-dioxygenase-like lactoylglutathione lyase family enzyme
MRATRLNHVSISAPHLEASVRFYVEVLGMERIPTYTFAFPVQYLRLGDLQLHLFERGTEAPVYHHIALDVDDFEAVYLKVQELGIADDQAFFSPAYELPDGSVQLYLRDPGGNLVEIDWPDATTLDRTVIPELRRLQDEVEQTPDGLRATLYLEPRPH